jgi:hypothetical protein
MKGFVEIKSSNDERWIEADAWSVWDRGSFIPKCWMRCGIQDGLHIATTVHVYRATKLLPWFLTGASLHWQCRTSRSQSGLNIETTVHLDRARKLLPCFHTDTGLRQATPLLA